MLLQKKSRICQRKRKFTARKKIDLELLHQRLGHRSTRSFLAGDNANVWKYVELRIYPEPFCTSCQISPMNKKDRSVGNRLILFYINCPMFGFQLRLLPVLFQIHEWIICCLGLIILPSLFDIFLRLPSIYRIVCLQIRENYSQLLFNLIHLYSVY